MGAMVAGKPAEPSMLVNVPRLVTAYYTEIPDPSVPKEAGPHSTKP
jgi:phosphoglucomutase